MCSLPSDTTKGNVSIDLDCCGEGRSKAARFQSPRDIHHASRHETTHPHAFQTKRRHFGLRFSDHPSINLDNYEEKYISDAYGKEVDADARVWRVYLDEAGPFSKLMIESFRDNLDLLMAGLFSAVVATTIAQSSQSLQQDYSQVAASLLDELIKVTRAVSEGTPTSSVGRSPLNSTSPFYPPASVLWTNRLWFTSLAFSLSTALIAALAKQWLLYFVSSVSGTPRDQVRMLQFRHLNFERWGVPIIIGLLPVLIHISLMAYFVGLVLFLMPLDHITAMIVLALTLIGCLIYVLTNFLPLAFPQCPYKTPLAVHVYPIWQYLKSSLEPLWHVHPTRFFSKQRSNTRQHVRSRSCSLQSAEAELVKQDHETLDVAALTWLLRTSTNPSVTSIVLQSASGFSLGFKAQFESDILQDMYPVLQASIKQIILERAVQKHEDALAASDEKLERLTRAMLQLYRPSSSDHYVLLNWSKYSNLPPQLEAVKSYGIFEGDNAPGFLVQHRTALSLHPVVWIHLLYQATSSVTVNRRISTSRFHETRVYSWQLALEFLERGLVSCKEHEEGPTTLIHTGHVKISHLVLDYLHALYCPWGTQCRFSRSCGDSVYDVTGHPSLLHLFACVWIFERNQSHILPDRQHEQPASRSNAQVLIQILERVVKHNDDKLAYYEICDIIGMLVESGRWLADPTLVSASSSILGVFNMLVGMGDALSPSDDSLSDVESALARPSSRRRLT